MKILFIVPGSGDGYYCGNCFRDNLHAQALYRAGHEVVVLPLYLPLKFLHDVSQQAPLFFPATTFYLEQKTGKKTPSWIRRILESRLALDMAGAMSGTTTATGMEDMTLSMIEGENQTFRRNVSQMANWIKQEQPQVIHLSSTLLIGIAQELKKAVGIPIVCSLQDEEVWLDSLAADDAHRAWMGIVERAGCIDSFVTSSFYYQQIIRERLPQLPCPTVVYPGVETARYQTESWPDNPTIGFFYRMNQADGLDILADAFVLLKERGSLPGLKLRIGGGYMSPDRSFLRQVRKKLQPYADDVFFEESYSWEQHASFYSKITVLSVPLCFSEGVGLYLCEAFAAGRPAVEPSSGSFPEIVGQGGLTYSPNHPAALAEQLERLLGDHTLFERCSQEASLLSQERYDERMMAENLLEIYRGLVQA